MRARAIAYEVTGSKRSDGTATKRLDDLALRAQRFRTAAQELSSEQYQAKPITGVVHKGTGRGSPLCVPRMIPKGYGAGLGGR